MAMHKKLKVKPDGTVEIQHFDSGGTVVGFGANPLTDVSNLLTVQNGYQAAAPDISAETGNYTAANAGQNQLTNALWNQARGTGPNPAQAELQEATNQNANAAASAAASNRGLNAGQAQRLANQGEINANQTAAGQAAGLEAQQQLNAEQGLASVYGQQENAASSMGSVVNQGELGAEGINSQTAQNNANAVNQTQGGILNNLSGGSMLGSISNLFSKGGIVGKDGKKALIPEHLKNVSDIYHTQNFDWGGTVQSAPLASVNIPEESQSTPTSFDMGESDSSGSDDSDGSGKSVAGLAALFSGGGMVPGKAKVDHDAYKNDTVETRLTPGETVIDLNTMKEKGKMGDAARMLAKYIESKNKGDGDESDFKEALKRASAGRK